MLTTGVLVYNLGNRSRCLDVAYIVSHHKLFLLFLLVSYGIRYNVLLYLHFFLKVLLYALLSC